MIERQAVPSGDGWVRHADAQQEPPSGQFLEPDGLERQRGWRAAQNVIDRRADLDARGHCGNCGQHDGRVFIVRLPRPTAPESMGLRHLGQLGDRIHRQLGTRVELDVNLHIRSFLLRSGSPAIPSGDRILSGPGENHPSRSPLPSGEGRRCIRMKTTSGMSPLLIRDGPSKSSPN